MKPGTGVMGIFSQAFIVSDFSNKCCPLEELQVYVVYIFRIQFIYLRSIL